jgi:ubiquinone/menaquinone biosynthesis C-methylase UbiE
MLRKVRAWWYVMANIGPSMGLARQLDDLFRYYVLKALEDDGLFAYLKEPRTYGHILAELGYVDSEYTRNMLDILIKDRKPMLSMEGNQYRRTDLQIPVLEELVGSTPQRIRFFLLMAEGMTGNIPRRLRNEPVELLESFEEDGRQLLTKLDTVLGNKIYSAMRSAVFALLTPDDRAVLRNGNLLEVGCGSGRETAEIWLKTQGKTHITGVDVVPGVVKLADESFESILRELNPAHPSVDGARPVFKVGSATQLPFDDNSFDAVLCLWMLHWTPDPRQAVSELVRVVRPGGLIFGAQTMKPLANPYFDLVFRTNENVHGFFWKEEFMRWFSEHQLVPEMATPTGIFRVRKQD